MKVQFIVGLVLVLGWSINHAIADSSPQSVGDLFNSETSNYEFDGYSDTFVYFGVKEMINAATPGFLPGKYQEFQEMIAGARKQAILTNMNQTSISSGGGCAQNKTLSFSQPIASGKSIIENVGSREMRICTDENNKFTGPFEIIVSDNNGNLMVKTTGTLEDGNLIQAETKFASGNGNSIYSINKNTDMSAASGSPVFNVSGGLCQGLDRRRQRLQYATVESRTDVGSDIVAVGGFYDTRRLNTGLAARISDLHRAHVLPHRSNRGEAFGLRDETIDWSKVKSSEWFDAIEGALNDELTSISARRPAIAGDGKIGARDTLLRQLNERESTVRIALGRLASDRANFNKIKMRTNEFSGKSPEWTQQQLDSAFIGYTPLPTDMTHWGLSWSSQSTARKWQPDGRWRKIPAPAELVAQIDEREREECQRLGRQWGSVITPYDRDNDGTYDSHMEEIYCFNPTGSNQDPIRSGPVVWRQYKGGSYDLANGRVTAKGEFVSYGVANYEDGRLNDWTDYAILPDSQPGLSVDETITVDGQTYRVRPTKQKTTTGGETYNLRHARATSSICTAGHIPHAFQSSATQFENGGIVNTVRTADGQDHRLVSRAAASVTRATRRASGAERQ